MSTRETHFFQRDLGLASSKPDAEPPHLAPLHAEEQLLFIGSYSLSLTIYLQFLQIASMEEEDIFANISGKTLSEIIQHVRTLHSNDIAAVCRLHNLR